MNKNHGFALPSALLIMVAVLALAVSTMFMTRTDLNTATNITTASIARHNADTTMSIALHALDVYVTDHGHLPDSLPLADNLLTDVHNWPGDTPLPRITFNADELIYRTDPLAGTAEIRITGTGPNSGRYETQAFVQLTTSSDGVPMIHPVVAHGITAGGTAIIRGSGTLVDAGMHGNRGYSLNVDPRSSLYECNYRREDGTCQTRFPYPDNVQVPYTAAESQTRYDACSPGWYAGYCDGNRPLQVIPDPFQDPNTGLQDFTPDYSNARNNVLCSLSRNPSQCSNPTLSDIKCDVTLGNNPSMSQAHDAANLGFTPGNTVCINGRVSLPSNVDLTGVNVIAKNQISFNGSPRNIENAILVSLQDGIQFNGSADFKNTRLFAEKSLNFNGSFAYEGMITLAARNNVQFNGSTRNPDGTARMAIISDGNIGINGSGDVWAAFLAGGDININGSASIYGGLVSLGSTTINGSLFLDSGVPFENPDLPTTVTDTGAPVMQVVSRR